MVFLSALAKDWCIQRWPVLSSSSTGSASRLKSRPLFAPRADPQDGCGVQLSKIATHVLSTAAILNAVRRHHVQRQDCATPATRDLCQNLSSNLLFDHLFPGVVCLYLCL